MEARDLVEAYYQVYEEEELDEGLRLKVAKAALTRTRNLPVGNPLRRTLSTTTQELVAKEADKKRKKREKRERERLQSASNQNESYDFYDIILFHLLDEGYAETSEAAEKMMLNMSEGWKNDILESAQQRLFDQPPLTHKRLTSKDPKATMSPGMRADARANELEAKGDPRAKRQRIKSKVMSGAFASSRNPR